MTVNTFSSRYRWAKQALDQAQKPAQGVPAYTRWVNRRGARVVAAFGYAAGWTPNMVTAMSAVLSVSGMVLLLVLPTAVWTGVPVAALLAAGYLFDSADGQLARLKRTSSKSGEWIDHVVDAFRSPAIHITVAIAVVIQLVGARGLGVFVDYQRAVFKPDPSGSIRAQRWRETNPRWRPAFLGAAAYRSRHLMLVLRGMGDRAALRRGVRSCLSAFGDVAAAAV